MKILPRKFAEIASLFVFLSILGCGSPTKLASFTVTPAIGPSGSLLAYGECDVPDGTLLLIRAVGGEDVGMQLETAVLTPVVRQRFYTDLNLYEPLSYRVEAILSPQFNPQVKLPAKAYSYDDPQIKIREDENGWELRREATLRIGAIEEEQRALQRHLAKLADALQILERHTGALQRLEKTGKAAELARWYRLYWEYRRDSVLDDPGIDPLLPSLHTRLKEADETLQRRFHDVLAKLTGAKEETDKMGADWDLLEQRLAKAREELAALQTNDFGKRKSHSGKARSE